MPFDKTSFAPSCQYPPPMMTRAVVRTPTSRAGRVSADVRAARRGLHTIARAQMTESTISPTAVVPTVPPPVAASPSHQETDIDDWTYYDESANESDTDDGHAGTATDADADADADAGAEQEQTSFFTPTFCETDPYNTDLVKHVVALRENRQADIVDMYAQGSRVIDRIRAQVLAQLKDAALPCPERTSMSVVIPFGFSHENILPSHLFETNYTYHADGRRVEFFVRRFNKHPKSTPTPSPIYKEGFGFPDVLAKGLFTMVFVFVMFSSPFSAFTSPNKSFSMVHTVSNNFSVSPGQYVCKVERPLFFPTHGLHGNWYANQQGNLTLDGIMRIRSNSTTQTCWLANTQMNLADLEVRPVYTSDFLPPVFTGTYPPHKNTQHFGVPRDAVCMCILPRHEFFARSLSDSAFLVNAMATRWTTKFQDEAPGCLVERAHCFAI